MLEKRGVRGDLYLVGGAALVIAYDARRATRDVDAIFEPKMAIYDAAREVAERLDLSEAWLNDAVKAYVEHIDPEATPVFDEPFLRVSAAPPRQLLAMKLLAARPEQDADDIRFLCGLLGITDARAALAVVAEVYPAGRLLPKTRFVVEEMFGP
jgi:hypothetical protein